MQDIMLYFSQFIILNRIHLQEIEVIFYISHDNI